jgi:hypothetical protein
MGCESIREIPGRSAPPQLLENACGGVALRGPGTGPGVVLRPTVWMVSGLAELTRPPPKPLFAGGFCSSAVGPPVNDARYDCRNATVAGRPSRFGNPLPCGAGHPLRGWRLPRVPRRKVSSCLTRLIGSVAGRSRPQRWHPNRSRYRSFRHPQSRPLMRRRVRAVSVPRPWPCG